MNEQAPPKKRTWIWVALGIFVLFVIIAAGGLFLAFSLLRQNMDVTAMSETAAAEEFAAVRARFAGRQPLFQLIDGRPQMVSDSSTRATPPQSVSSVNLLAWDEDDEQLVRVSIPFWLLRLKSGPIRITASSAGLVDREFDFRVEDVERHGPGLLLDLPDQRDGRVLIWAE